MMINRRTLEYLIVILLSYFIFIHHYLAVIYVDTVIVASIIILIGFLLNRNESVFIFDKNNLIVIGIILWLLFGISYSNAPAYGLTKGVKFFVFYLLSFYTAKTITRNPGLFLKTMTVFLLIMMLDFFYNFGKISVFINQISVTSRLDEFGGTSGFTSPIEAARYIAFVILLIFISLKEKILKKPWIIISYALIVFGLVFLVLLGSKGPILSMALAISFLTIFYSKSRVRSVILFFIPIILILIIYFSQEFILSKVPSGLSEYFFNRYFNVESFTDRPDLFALALNDLDNYFIGEGTGNFGFLWYGFDKRAYPHNIFIELFYENGIVGLTLLLVLLLSTLWRSINIKNRIKRVLFTVSILFFLFASLTSGDISGNPLLLISIIYANFSYLDTPTERKSNEWISFDIKLGG